MKRFYAILLVFLLWGVFFNSAFAYKLADKALLQEAAVYAVTRRNLEWDAFFAPWTIFEEKSPILKAPSERAIVYTPFLLVAMENKQTINQNKSLDEGKIAELLKSYEGNFVVCTILRSNRLFITESLSAIVQQDNRIVKPRYIHGEPIIDLMQSGQAATPSYEMRVYFYFPQEQINPGMPVNLLVFEQGENARRFLLPLNVIN